MWQIFDRYSHREMEYLHYWGLGVEAGAIDEEIVLPQLKGHAMRQEKHDYNGDRRHYGEPHKQIFEIVKKGKDGKNKHTHKAWDKMTTGQRAETYIREYKFIGRQVDKVAWMYDSAIGHFGEVEGEKFKQLTIGFPRPEWEGPRDDDD
jgi:hypothetical protein